MALAQDLAKLDVNIVTQPFKKPIGFLQEDNGNYSSMRLMSFIKAEFRSQEPEFRIEFCTSGE